MDTLWPYRSLPNHFVEALLEGTLVPILEFVKSNDTLDLELRGNLGNSKKPDTVNVYYRGGSLLAIEPRRNGFLVSFNRNYFETDRGQKICRAIIASDEHTTSVRYRICIKGKVHISTKDEAEELVLITPQLKEAMDCFRTLKNRAYERQFEQLVISENNFGSLGVSTDFFICDMEYSNSYARNTRFDMVGAYWPGDKVTRKRSSSARLVFFEMKYGTQAYTGNSGIKDHIKTARNFLTDKAAMDELRKEMTSVMIQKTKLGLFGKISFMPRFGFTDEKPMYVFLFANHVPRSGTLARELASIQNDHDLDIRIAVSSYAGYGLFISNVLPVNEFLNRFMNKRFESEEE